MARPYLLYYLLTRYALWHCSDGLAPANYLIPFPGLSFPHHFLLFLPLHPTCQCDLASEGFLGNVSQLEEYCKDKGFHAWFETSAKENKGIDEAARCLVAKVWGLLCGLWLAWPLSAWDWSLLPVTNPVTNPVTYWKNSLKMASHSNSQNSQEAWGNAITHPHAVPTLSLGMGWN